MRSTRLKRTHVLFLELSPCYSAKRRIGGDLGFSRGRRRICGIPHPPPAAPAAGGWGIPRSALRRVDKGWIGGVAVAGWPASLFWCSATSPPWRRRRWRSRVAGTSLLRRCSLRRRRRARDGCVGGRRRRCEAAAVRVGGVLLMDLAVSAEAGWRWPQVGSGRCSGRVPGRWSIFAFRSSSSELVVDAARQRLRARSSFVPWWSALDGRVLRRRRRWSSRVLEALEVEDGVSQQRRSCILLVLIFACIRLCNPLYI